MAAALQAAVSNEPALVAGLIPDAAIGAVYRDFIAAIPRPVTLVLATGYAVYSGDLAKLAPGHEAVMLAPKAIGPKLLAAHEKSRPGSHALLAAFNAPAAREAQALVLARALGFAEDNLVRVPFETEAVGDLISEQNLLCGGLFTLLEHSMRRMREAGVPDRLIREECVSELELIASLIKEKGPASTFSNISQTAQCGAVVTRERLLSSGLEKALDAQADEVVSRRFPETLRRSPWRAQAAELVASLESWEKSLGWTNKGDKK
jgi:ketol-acid reductoisomerase